MKFVDIGPSLVPIPVALTKPCFFNFKEKDIITPIDGSSVVNN